MVAATLFGVLHQIYVSFGASTQRWKILKTHVKNLRVKPISDTRWECRLDTVKAVRYQTAAVYDALVEESKIQKQGPNFSHLVRFIVSNEYDQQIDAIKRQAIFTLHWNV